MFYKNVSCQGKTPDNIRELLKAVTEMLLLLVLRRKPMYTYEIMREIETLSGDVIVFNTLYQAIYHLQGFAYIREDRKEGIIIPKNEATINGTRKERFIMAKNLILYYSRKGQNYVNGSIVNLQKGNTEICAEFIQKAVGGDLFEIETVKEYSTDYTTCTEEAQAELRAKERPELKNYLSGIADYDNIFVCGPCWWGTFPCAVFTQLEKLDWTGKNVFALMTHEGSGLGHCERDLQKTCKGAKVGKGLAVHGADAARSENTVVNWAKQCV